VELPFEVRPLPGEIRGVRPFPALWRDALAADPSLARQEAVLEQRRLDRTVARNELRPELDLVATGGYLGLDEEDAQTAFDNLTEGQGYAWSVGFEFSMPWGRRGEKAALRSADKELEQESLRLLELKQQLFRELRSAWRSYNARTESREAAELTVSLQEAAFAQEQEKYAEGLSVFRDVLEAQQDLDLARERLLETRFQQIRTRIRIDELTGRLLDLYNIPEELFR
jgi:multidrug efflux system outer membrane protein